MSLIVTVENLSTDQIFQTSEYALAKSAKPFLRNTGFIIIVIAATWHSYYHD